MTALSNIDLCGWLSEQLVQASPDLLRAMLTTFVQALMGAEADSVCGAGYGGQPPVLDEDRHQIGRSMRFALRPIAVERHADGMFGSERDTVLSPVRPEPCRDTRCR